jgi:hypothetical protein
MAERAASAAMTDHFPRVVPLRPDAPAPAVRGWHGMTLRTHRYYDWSAWAAADPNGNAVLVDIAPWSPAATAGIMSGDYVVSIDGESLDVWDAHGAPVGAHVHVVCYRPAAAAHQTADVVLAPRPARQRRQRPPRPARHPQVVSGRRLGTKQRLQWQQAMGTDHALTARARDVARELATHYADRTNIAFPGRATLARDLGVSVRTIDRAVTTLRHRGWIRVVSGRRTGEANRYILTWPAGY